MVDASRRRISARFHLSSIIESDYADDLSFKGMLKGSMAAFLSRIRRRVRSRKSALLLALVLFATTTVYVFRSQSSLHAAQFLGPLSTDRTPKELPTPPKNVNPLETEGSHPIFTLMAAARQEFEAIKVRQSKSLTEAVAEYRRRYGIHPPPNFDKWYAFATGRDIQLIDEYDTIHQLLTPFWALNASTIRARAREALGFDNNLIGVLIRGGNITRQEGGTEWMQKAIDGMTAPFRQHLPDLDLCFNVHDEPRVILQHGDLSRMVDIAQASAMPAANAVEQPRNSWSPRPGDLNDGKSINEIGRTRFNFLEHQAVWSHARMSCPPDSAARSLLDIEEALDDDELFSLRPLGFIRNETAFTDICNSPSFSSAHGIFDGPNSFSVAQDLFPIFSQSKVSSFQDILYPSPWYWYDKVPYDESTDMPWEEKESKMYWRGSTTGGFSRYGGWRRQHRQRLVMKMNAQEDAKILLNRGSDENPIWAAKSAWRPDFSAAFDIKFTHVGQCDRGDCAAQKEFFTIVPNAKPEEAWKWKFLLDMDGNAFSGRFYAFLKSKSLVFKQALFREWHSETLRPWVHYVPMSLKGEEWVESIRWFSGTSTGKEEAQKMAMAGREWAGQALRNEDLEVWFFRLLLEYSRLVDDDRENIGYAPQILQA